MEQEDLVVSNISSRTGEMSIDETEEESATLHVSVSSALESPRKKQRCAEKECLGVKWKRRRILSRTTEEGA